MADGPNPTSGPAAAGGAGAVPPRTLSPTGPNLVIAAIKLAGAGAIAAGAMRSEEPWSIVGVVAGVVLIAIAVLAWLARSPWAGAGAAAFTLAAATVTTGAVIGSTETALAGVLALVIAASTAGAAGMIARRLDALGAGTGGTGRGSRVGLDEEDRSLLRRIEEHAMLSDNARRVLFRERELALLDRAIEDDIRDGRFDVALTLCDELADVFGERERAEAYRERVLKDRRQSEDAALGHGFAELDRALTGRQWQAARAAAERLRTTYSDATILAEVERRFVAARDAHKVELEAEFLAAAGRGDVEDAMRRLREMDHYLTPHEAEQFRELAGGVIKKHRENLGVRFKLAVNDHRWTEALEVGSTIIEEFPNSRMAAEVRSMIDLLRGRATGDEDPGVAAPGSGADLGDIPFGDRPGEGGTA